MIDTINAAKSSAIIYSIAETAKANNLKPYEYFEYLLIEIPKHMDDTDRSFLDDLLPWLEKLPDNIRKPKKKSARSRKRILADKVLTMRRLIKDSKWKTNIMDEKLRSKIIKALMEGELNIVNKLLVDESPKL